MNAVTDDRIGAVAALLADEGIDLLVATPSADLLYLTSHSGHASERPTMLAVQPDGAAALVLPQLEAAGAALSDVRVVPYEEGENPFETLRATVQAAPQRVAISDQAWASHVLNLQKTFPDAEFIPASPILRELRMRKSSAEIEALRAAAAMADAAFARLIETQFIGHTEREVGERLQQLLREQGLEPASWGPIVGSGPNSASPHHSVSERIIQHGDAVVLDFGGVYNGYQADITRTVHAAQPEDEFRRVYEIVRQAQEAGVQAVAPGVPAERVDRITRQVISAAGYGDFFIHRTGHGLGLDTHEEPYVIEGNPLPLEPGMVFSVEPGVYLPGRFGVRIEDIVVVTTAGVERLNKAPRELIVVR